MTTSSPQTTSSAEPEISAHYKLLIETTEDSSELFLEQYKLFIQVMEQTTARRSEVNRFYVTVLSALLAILSLGIEGGFVQGNASPVFLVVSILGILICIVWYYNIQSYQQLNAGKFKVIHDMEQRLPYPCYDEEWRYLAEGKDPRVYRPFTTIERRIPVVLALPYIGLFIYGLVTLI